MIDLHDAWTWYVTTRTHLKLFGRLGRKHWDELPWDGMLGTDDTAIGSRTAAALGSPTPLIPRRRSDA